MLSEGKEIINIDESSISTTTSALGQSVSPAASQTPSVSTTVMASE